MISINGYTLFPHSADWSVNPAWKRKWKTGVGTGTTGNEQRAALRALPLHTLTYTITATTLQERGRLDARIDQATQSGLACVPFCGRGVALSANSASGVNTITLVDVANAWPWANGDYAMLLGDDDTVYDAWQVTGIAGNVLTLAGNLVNAWAAGSMVWPVLFGMFSTDKKQNQLTTWHAGLKITVQQLVAERNAQLGSTPATVPGVGAQVIGSTNTIG
jgi:hypothetical protein